MDGDINTNVIFRFTETFFDMVQRLTKHKEIK
jgi:hypothetical protein